MILVVDDDPTVLEVAQRILNRDRQVFLASDSARALELAQSLGFSVAIVDLNMQGDGLDLIRRLHEAAPDLPIIAICGQVQGQLPENLKALGVVEFLNTPVTLEWKPVVERIRARRFHA